MFIMSFLLIVFFKFLLKFLSISVEGIVMLVMYFMDVCFFLGEFMVINVFFMLLVISIVVVLVFWVF